MFNAIATAVDARAGHVHEDLVVPNGRARLLLSTPLEPKRIFEEVVTSAEPLPTVVVAPEDPKIWRTRGQPR